MNNIGLDRRHALFSVAGTFAAVASSAATAAQQDVNIDQRIFNVGPYMPIEPKEVLKVRQVINNSEQDIYYSSMTEEAVRHALGIVKASITVAQEDAHGTLQHLVGQATADKGIYEVTVDFGRYRDEDVRANGTFVGRGRVGVGLRLKAKLQTFKSNLQVGSLIPISASVAANKMNGTIESTVIGIINPRVSDLIQLPTQISEETINKAIESMGAMKVLVDAPDTKTVPHLLAVALSQGQNADAVVRTLT